MLQQLNIILKPSATFGKIYGAVTKYTAPEGVVHMGKGRKYDQTITRISIRVNQDVNKTVKEASTPKISILPTGYAKSKYQWK